jgi:hypothetical protein
LPLWMGFLRYSTYVNLYKTYQAGIEGNTEGEGRLLGGIIFIKKSKLNDLFIFVVQVSIWWTKAKLFLHIWKKNGAMRPTLTNYWQ